MAFPSYSGPLKNPFNDITNEDDEFGDFTSAVTFPSIGNGIAEVGQTMPTNSVFFNPIPADDDSDNDDEFGDFCGPIVVPEPPSVSSSFIRLDEPNITKYQPNYNIDLESDLTAVPQLSWMKDDQEEEEFTNFTAAEPDLFIGPPVESEPDSSPLELHDSNDDFGEFTQAVVVASPVEDLFILDAIESPVLPIEELDQPTIEETIEEPKINWDEPVELLEQQPEINWDQQAEPEEEVNEEPVAPVEEEFGDFTDFQMASDNIVQDDDDEFDDFEAAPAVNSDSTIAIESTPENHMQRVLTTLFPVSNPPECTEPINPLTNSPGGTLWSYVSQLDSTPALSFSWRHSAAQQRFLHSLHIDNMLQTGNPAYRWTSPASANSSVSESFTTTESTVTLDLDFFLNPSGQTTTTVPSTDSILETIERELLSRPPAQSPAPVRHSTNQLSDIFEHLHLDTTSSSPQRQGVVDLLQ